MKPTRTDTVKAALRAGRDTAPPRVLRLPWLVVSESGVLLGGALYEAVAARLAEILGAKVVARG